MSPDRLEELVRQADLAANPPPAVGADLAERVRRRARRRRVVNTTTWAAAAAIALTVGAAAIMSRTGSQPAPVHQVVVVNPDTPVTDPRDSQAQVAELRAEIDRLRAETEATRELTRQLLTSEKQRRRLTELRRTLAQPDPMEQVRQEVDKAAFILVYQADRMLNELNLTESAIASYRRVIELFPETPSAEVARRRLAEIERAKGERS